jgi:hypothetical protein
MRIHRGLHISGNYASAESGARQAPAVEAPPSPSSPRWSIAAAYRQGGVRFVRRAVVLGQLVIVLVVSAVGPALTSLFVPLRLGDMAFMSVLAFGVYVVDVGLAVRALQPGLETLARWEGAPDPQARFTAWSAVADLPFAPLRRRSTYFIMAALLVAWDRTAVSRLGLPLTSFLLIFPGSVLAWLYWLAVRFFLTEQLIRPVLADISSGAADNPPVPVRVTLGRRLIVIISTIAVTTGTVVAGAVGEHSIATITIGIGTSIIVTIVVAGLLAMLSIRSVTAPIADLRAVADRSATVTSRCAFRSFPPMRPPPSRPPLTR